MNNKQMIYNLIHNFEVTVLDTNNREVNLIEQTISSALQNLNCDCIVKHKSSGRVMKTTTKLNTLNKQKLDAVFCDWELVTEYQPELNTPVLFIYDGAIYSGYYYETPEDIENNTVSYLINVPDKDNSVTGNHGELLHNATHWMYISNLKLPLL